MQHILFPADFSGISGYALPYALMLAETFEARLTLVHVLHSVLEPDHFTRLAPVYNRQEAEHKLQRLKETLPRSVESDCRIVEGILVDALDRLAEELHSDLIVMGTAGARYSPEVAAWSHTAALIARTRHPVLVVPMYAPRYAPDKIVLAFDLNPLQDLAVLQPLVNLIRHFGGELLLLNVVEERAGANPSATSEAVHAKGLLSGLPYSLHVVENEYVDEGIARLAEEAQARLVVLIKRKRHFPASFFHAGLTQKVALYTQVPLLVLPE